MIEWIKIRTPTRYDWDILMSYLEDKGHKWHSGQPPSKCHARWDDYETKTVVHIDKKTGKIAYSNNASLNGHEMSLEEYIGVYLNTRLIKAINENIPR